MVLVLLLGEIDLSVGSASGLAASVMAVMVVYEGYVSILAGALTGLAIGVLYAVLFTKVGVPSFVITLAGLLGPGSAARGAGQERHGEPASDSRLVEFARSLFVTGVASYVLVLVVAVGHGARCCGASAAARPPGSPRRPGVAVRTGCLPVACST